METVVVQDAILHYIYCKNFGEGDPTLDSLDKWAGQQQFNKVSFWDQYDCLIKTNLANFLQDQGAVRLTPKGVLHTEKAGLVSPTLVSKNRAMRKRLLQTLRKHLDKKGATITIDELIEQADLEGQYCYGNVELLIGLNYIRWIIQRSSLSINAKVYAQEAPMAKVRK